MPHFIFLNYKHKNTKLLNFLDGDWLATYHIFFPAISQRQKDHGKF